MLPFVNMSPDTNQEFFADGISEELLNLLAKIPQLRVISRSSAFSFKGKDLDITEIARQLRVNYVLEGSVRKAGNQVRISAQLIDARSDSQLWSETYDRPLDNIFEVQDEIAASVVTQLKLKLFGATPTTRVIDPRAYALYLQGRFLMRQGTQEGFEQSIALFRQALEIEPNDPAAWDGLARDYTNEVNSGTRPIDEGYRLAREAVERALAIDPDFAPAHSRMGVIAMSYDGDLAAAARHFERALEMGPTNTDIIGNAAVLAHNLGRVEESIALGEYVVARDPVNPTALANLGFSYQNARRLDDAIASYRTALSLSPDYDGANYAIGVALLLKGDAAGALAAMQKEGGGWRDIGLPMAWHAMGDQTRSDASLASLIRHVGDRLGIQHRLCARVSRRARSRIRVARQGRRVQGSGTGRNSGRAVVHKPPLRPALAAVPAQARHGPRATRGDQVRRKDGALAPANSRTSPSSTHSPSTATDRHRAAAWAAEPDTGSANGPEFAARIVRYPTTAPQRGS